MPYVVIDKNADVGGTWLENTYPGCRVDIPNHYYSYSFAQRDDWPFFYSPQRGAAPVLPGVRRRVRHPRPTSASAPRSRPSSATRRRRRGRSHGRGRRRGGDARGQRRDQRGRPAQPAAAARTIEGRETFAGPSFHSAAWDHAVDLDRQAGRRRSAPGAARPSSSPIVAEQVAQLEIFQRTPNWMFPVPHYHERGARGLPVAARPRAVLPPVVPLLAVLAVAPRLLRPMAEVDPGWPDQERSVERAQRPAARSCCTEASRRSTRTAPTCWTRSLPQYPPAAKRIIVDNGVWAADAAPRQRHADDDRHRADRPRGRRHGRRRAARVRRAASTAPASSRRSSSRR